MSDTARVLAVIGDDGILAAASFYGWEPDYKSIYMALAVDSARWATPRIFARICVYPFIDMGCNRVTALIAGRNTRSQKLTEGVGFTFEGLGREGFLDDDIVAYSMLRRECRWLEGKS